MARRSISTTFFIAITLTALGVVVAAASMFRYSLIEGFADYVNRTELARLGRIESFLVSRYRDEGGWAFVRGPRDLMPPPPEGARRMSEDEPNLGDDPAGRSRERSLDMSLERQEAREARDQLPPPPPVPQDRMDFGRRIALFDEHGRLLAGPPQARGQPQRALRLDGASSPIGFIALAPLPVASDEMMRDFLSTQSQRLIWIALLAVISSAFAAWVLARLLRRPIAELTLAAKQLSEGRLDARVNSSREDELGELAADFNIMAARLQRGEQSRRQWVADTSHELRTPLTILRAHTQAMRDGVMPLNERGLDVIDYAVGELDALVNDLFQLAKADVGSQDFHFEPVMLTVLLDDVVERYTEPLRLAGLTLDVDAPPEVLISGDPGRLSQLFGNILGNSARYTDTGGQVRIGIVARGPLIEITIDDSPPAVPSEALSHLFDRFYRVESSRSRKAGGAGLGLAICQSIVAAHGGKISAHASPLGGLRIVLTLPIIERKGRRQ